eukprot:TRINITY_DN10742_c0_g2_i1.p1 TRINITY_DN10742_c0_g2~~TRINITY_DN10742_c0_g2_i1.p1  ORF type:complete len:359 (+),score=45.69 TRINITY_DN10742_c0_g2_i1:950-2026(+)
MTSNRLVLPSASSASASESLTTRQEGLSKALEENNFPALPESVQETITESRGSGSGDLFSTQEAKIFPRVIHVYSSTVTLWQMAPDAPDAFEAPLYIVKAFDHSDTRRRPDPSLLDGIIKHAESVEHSRMLNFYKGWATTELTKQIHVLSYPYLVDKPEVSLQDIYDFFRMYQTAFKEWVHGDVLARNIVFPCVLDLDFARHIATEELPHYPASYNTDESLHRHPELTGDDVKVSDVPMRKEHDLYSLGHVLQQLCEAEMVTVDTTFVSELGKWLVNCSVVGSRHLPDYERAPYRQKSDFDGFDPEEDPDAEWANALLDRAVSKIEAKLPPKASMARSESISRAQTADQPYRTQDCYT